MALSYLSNNADFKLSNISEELIAVFVLEPSSKLFPKVEAELNKRVDELKAKNIKILFLTTNATDGVTNSDYILDVDREILNQAEFLKSKSKLQEYLILFKKENDNLKYLIHKENPEHEYEWVQVVSDFADNYVNPDPNEKDLYKWGQIVPETGDYLCVDCGYIATFAEGEIFPVCEVCLSGEPAGPTSADGAYWEKI